MDIKILKLTNGDEIITTLSAVKDNSVVTAHNPLRIHTYPRATKMGIEESMALSRWSAFSENGNCEIIKNNIVAVSTASIGIGKFYDYCILRMKEGKSAHLASKEPTDEQLQMIEDELKEELFDEYDDEYLSKTIH